MLKKILFIFLLFGIITTYSNVVYAEDNEPVYTQLRVVDAGTFNEYRYRITDEFFNLRNKYELEGQVNVSSANKILDFAKKGYNYLPDSLSNKNYYNYLKTSIERGIKYPNNASNYTEIVGAIENFLDKTNIKSVKGKVDAFPSTGNAPLTVTLRGNVVDPTGTKISGYNYTWWIHENGKRKVLGNNISFTYVFKEEGNFSIFLDVVSSHKNVKGYVDVLPFSSRADVIVKEKIASVIIKVNSLSLRNDNELNFTPEEARYGLLFDATSSTPTSGATFTNTEWDFGNGDVREYTGSPKVERVIYAKEGEFTATLNLRTNEGKHVERKFLINVHDPIATINASSEEGYLGDKFTFSAQNTINNKDLSYAWEIIDLNKDKVIFRKAGNLFTYSFKEKGKYNVKMTVTEPSGEMDIDSQIIYINSRAPTANFIYNIPFPNKPNRVFFDATKSFDPDFSDDGKLKYGWLIDGNRVELEDSNFNGSTGYFTFDSIGDHSVILDVTDLDSISSQKKSKVNIKSILSVEFFPYPRVAIRESNIRFVSVSPEAKFYEWDFGDGITKGGKDANIAHKYMKSGVFNVKLNVIDIDDNTNTFSKNVYIGESNTPYSFIGIRDSKKNDIAFDQTECDGKGAYIVNRVDSVSFSGKESIDITGETTGLTYSWKLGKESYKNSAEFTKKFDELGCFPIKLTVKSEKNNRTHSTSTYIQVKNLKPILSSIDVKVVDSNTDPVIVNVSALGAKDRDGVIQSYLWYYYTDIDSEPQDFRATKRPSTSFVLPKVTGNYYFVVVMKDNNEERVTSEEITGSKYFMTLTGDNLNTPLVKLSVNDSSLAIGDEAIFTANVENILGQDLSKKVKYSWDFDGDGFYDKETSSNIVSHKYLSGGEKYVKVKAKYKGFSNTKNITVDVSNVLKPNFGYISIGNKFMFFDKSIGSSDSYEWDLGDGNIIKNQQYFSHIYTDTKATHIVSLKITEGTKVKTIEQKVIKNVKNRILAKKEGIVIFSSPSIVDEEIILDNEGDNIYIYLGESNPDISNYIIDYDLDYDSDLNGGNDDDEDNKNDDSYDSGEVIKVELNNNKIQNIRVFLKNTDGEFAYSRDLIIVKSYIEEKSIDLKDITFKGVSDVSKFKIEKLKGYIDNLPKEYKLKGLMYVQKLQEEWSDNRGKTNVILEFEGFIYDIGVNDSENIINLLESLLVENQEDKSEKAITFNALKNLIPGSILCQDISTMEDINCYDSMLSKLEVIRDNDNIDENKILGTEILKIVEVDKIMTNKEKTDFKAILKTFVYGGIANIPDKEKEEVYNSDKELSSSSALLGLFMSIIKWIIIIILGFSGIILLYYIYYLLVNKDSNLGFQDFIIEKTSGVKKTKNKVISSIEDDILADLSDNEEKKENDISETKEQETTVKKEEKSEEPKVKILTEKKEEKEEVKNINKEEVPDWLKGSFSEDASETKEKEAKVKKEEKSEEPKVKISTEKKEEKEEVKNINKEEVPDWLKGSFSEDASETKEKEAKVKKEEKSEEPKVKILTEKKEEKEEEVKNINKEEVPDWLKGSFSEDASETKEKESKVKKEEKSEEPKVKISTEKKEEKEGVKNIDKKDIEEIIKIDDDNIPDWLKGSFDEESKKESKKEYKKEEESKKIDFSKEDKTVEQIKPEKDKNDIKTKTKTDDNIPDWLKDSFDKEDKKEDKKEKESKNINSFKDEKTILEINSEEIENKEPKKIDIVKEDIVKKEKAKEDIVKKEKAKVKDKKVIKEKLIKPETNKISKPKQTINKSVSNKSLTKNKEVESKKDEGKIKVNSPENKKKLSKTKPQENKEDIKIKTKPISNKTNNKLEENKSSELWDDGMKVPDWLKTDDDK